MADEPSGGPAGATAEQPTVSWLILQRLDDLRGDIGRLDARIDRLEPKIETVATRLDAKIDEAVVRLDLKIDSVRNWSLGLLLLAILGLLAKLLIPGA